MMSGLPEKGHFHFHNYFQSEVILACCEKNLFLMYVNNKGKGEPVHPHVLFSAFVNCLLDLQQSKFLLFNILASLGSAID